MRGLTGRFVEAVDWASERLSRIASWCVLVSCAISAGNAMIRYGFNIGSNAWLELQWYLFAVTVFFGAPFLLKVNEHVRVDVLYVLRSGRGKAMTDLLGLIFFFMPVCLAMVHLSINIVMDSWRVQEMSSSAGGLIRWPVKALIPIGFVLLSIQGVAEIIKRVAFLRGTYEMDTHYEKPLQ